ncbi:MAG TPA: inositol monophosphatase family protein [Acidimicrobiia bacterium]|nr:inositol monophosphatase family protein [Acidimicrobiia bacterium]
MTAAAPAPDEIEALALAAAHVVADAVRPLLGRGSSRAEVGVAPGGDVTMAIDDVAEHALAEHLAAAGDIAYYSEDRGLVQFGRPRALFVVDPVDGTRPAAAGLESGCVSIAVVPPTPEATLGEVTFGVVHEIRSGDRFWARRGGGAGAARADGRPIALACSPNDDLDALFWSAGTRGRPTRALASVLGDLVDRSAMAGGYVDPASATFSMTRIATGQLDAYVDVAARMVRDVPDLEPEFRRVGRGSVCTNFPYDVAAAALVVTEAGGVVTDADGARLDAVRAVGSGDDFRVAVVAAGTVGLHERLLAEVDRGMARLVAATRPTPSS